MKWIPVSEWTPEQIEQVFGHFQNLRPEQADDLKKRMAELEFEQSSCTPKKS